MRPIGILILGTVITACSTVTTGIKEDWKGFHQELARVTSKDKSFFYKE